ncbi:hypothetical protein Sjap_015461 [Stephania japonica]|uniref:Uncharacterized protein n=1 Tax=Stephania japonica TaxID=461633 RepID=A0AAP0NSI8_9MAGN
MSYGTAILLGRFGLTGELIRRLAVSSLLIRKNEEVFSNIQRPVDTARCVFFKVDEIMHNIGLPNTSKLGRGLQLSRHWEPPGEGWYKLNWDGVMRQEDNEAGAGGL